MLFFRPAVAVFLVWMTAAAQHPEIDAFNRAFFDATRHMDTPATLALWDDEGVSLLPSTNPIRGKSAITKFMNDVMASLAGAHMTKFEGACFDIQQSGDWASEWCTEHQLVELGGGKPPFDGYGKMLLVLHRTAGKWRLREEMWNQALAPEALNH
ncbi:MAG: nuclear transport factor 2 family protein [Gemmatimonadaceae bacterium]|nr:nuclear transport factor 2 family protein [Gemmatimonadaceae bacterium]